MNKAIIERERGPHTLHMCTIQGIHYTEWRKKEKRQMIQIRKSIHSI